jgi:hypothetical protein
MTHRTYSVVAVALLPFVALADEKPDRLALEVSEGANLAAALKFNLLRVYRDTGRIPSNRTEARVSPNPTDTYGKFVASVDIVDGSIVVTYGRDADERIAGKTLVISLYENAANQFLWRCGDAALPEGFVPLGTYMGKPIPLQPSTVPSDAMPPACHKDSSAVPTANNR